MWSRLVQMGAAALRELGRRLRERLAAEAGKGGTGAYGREPGKNSTG
jgi:hypothetical protein